MIIRISDHKTFPAEWTERRADVVMQNPRIGVVQHVVTCDDKGSPKYDQPLLVTNGGVVCVVRDAEQNLALLRRYREVCVPDWLPRVVPIVDGATCGACSFEFPRGGSEPGETSVEAALRETEEEVGLAAIRATLLDRINADTAFFPYGQDVFLVEVDRYRRAVAPHDPNEEIEVMFTRLPELLVRVRSGDIFCGLTKAALSAYIAHLFAGGTLAEALTR